MTNSRHLTAAIMFVMFLLMAKPSASAQEYDDLDETGVFGYTSIDFNPTSQVVTAYSETDLYGGSTYYYQAYVQVSSNGYQSTGEAPTPGVTWAAANVSYQGSPGNTYYAYGRHWAFITNKFIGAQYNDPYGLEEWASYFVDFPWSYPFTAFSTPGTAGNTSIDLGETYDTAVTTIPVKCNDQRDTIISEYVKYGTPYYPGCGEFTQSSGSIYFNFAALNTGQYTWADLQLYFFPKIDALFAMNTYALNSAYRNPAREYTVSTALPNGRYHPGSRHQYGDAIDVDSTQSTWQTYANDGHTLGACVEPTSVQGNSYLHAHLDWRKLATTGQIWTTCPKGW